MKELTEKKIAAVREDMENNNLSIKTLGRVRDAIIDLHRIVEREKEIISSGDTKSIRRFYKTETADMDKVDSDLKEMIAIYKEILCGIFGEFAGECARKNCTGIINVGAAIVNFFLNNIDHSLYPIIGTNSDPMGGLHLTAIPGRKGDMLGIEFLPAEGAINLGIIGHSPIEFIVGSKPVVNVADIGPDWIELLPAIFGDLIKIVDDRESTDDSNEECNECHECEFLNTGTQECDKYLLERCNTTPGVSKFPLKEHCSFTKQHGTDYCAQCFYNECGVCVRVH